MALTSGSTARLLQGGARLCMGARSSRFCAEFNVWRTVVLGHVVCDRVVLGSLGLRPGRQCRQVLHATHALRTTKSCWLIEH